ncbi:MAG: response regulator [Chitinispirillaceae bacterium]
MRILVVEDDMVSIKIMEKMLESYGDVDVVADGAEAVRMFDSGLESDPYDVVFLDIMLPEMDGQEVLKSIRKKEEKCGIFGSDGVKIIMTTALDDSRNVLQAFRAQCEGYLVKPISKDKIIEQFRKLDLL